MRPLRNRGLGLAALLLACGCLGGPHVGPSAGKEAPPVQGVDAAERTLRLSDCRGQVVLLDFWRHG
jgi:hypothetical protein